MRFCFRNFFPNRAFPPYSIGVQLSLISRHANKKDFKSSITIAPQNDDFDSIRAEYTEMLQTQLERGNNGLIKTKFLTFTIEAKDIKSAQARLARIETDTLNHFKVMGAAARVLDGKQRPEVLHGLFHPDGERFNFAWEWLPASGLSVKDFIAPSSFRFGAREHLCTNPPYGYIKDPADKKMDCGRGSRRDCQAYFFHPCSECSLTSSVSAYSSTASRLRW